MVINMADTCLQATAFPVLDDSQIAHLGQCAAALLQRLSDGQTLFKAGDRDYKFFVVKSGSIDIVDCSKRAIQEYLPPAMFDPAP